MGEQNEGSPLGHDFGWELEQLRTETQARPAELAAIRLRLRSAQQDPGALAVPWAARWRALAPLGVGGLAVAAAALWLAVRPAPVPETQQMELFSSQWTAEQVHQDVALEFEGRGALEAKGKNHAITWREGRLKVSVTPKQDIQLDVHTPEATVSVVGTVFEVRRDLTGTTVSVERGKVAVRCGDGAPAPLVPEDGTRFCQTTSPAGLAALAKQRRADGDLDGALDVAADGLARADAHSYAAAELYWQQALAFEAQDSWADALRSSEALLATGQGDFETDAHHMAALAGRMADGCAAAGAHLRWLADAEAATPYELAHLADCTAETEPEAARVWLESAMAGATDSSLQQQLRERIDQLER